MASDAGNADIPIELGSDLVAMAGRQVKALRDQRDWSQATLADEAGISRRTVVEAEQSRPVTRTSATAISTALGITDSRLFGPINASDDRIPIPANVVSRHTAPSLADPSNPPQILELKIDLGGVIGGDLKQTAALKELIGFLQRLLPDKCSVIVISTVSGSAAIGIRHTAANEAVVRDPRLASQLKAFGVNRFELIHHAQLAQAQDPNTKAEQGSDIRATSRDASRLPKTIPSLSKGMIDNYLARAFSEYETHHAVLRGKGWRELDDRDKLLFILEEAKREIAMHLSMLDWRLLGVGKRFWLHLSNSTLRELAMRERQIVQSNDTSLYMQYNYLIEIADQRHLIDFAEDFIQKI